jgi:CHASE1-domain containing sensor protein
MTNKEKPGVNMHTVDTQISETINDHLPEAFKPSVLEAAAHAALEQTRYLYLGGQEWTVSMTPLASPAASPTNLVSLTILGLGLVLSGLLTYLAYRWQWKAALFQAQARVPHTPPR